MSTPYWLTNIKLETGYLQDDKGSYTTKTELFHLKIEDGKITEKQISSFEISENEETVDCKGFLALPSFKEMHNHLDKTYLSLDWKACRTVRNLEERLQYEAMELEELAPTAKQRASKMIELLLSKGSTHIRTHVNIDPYIGLKNLEGVKAALEDYSDKLTYEIVAFPQHGLLRENVIPLMKEAMRSGANIVGGLDPAGIDRNIEKSLYEIMNLSTEFNADIDIHLHDGGHVGYYTVDKFAEMVEDAGWHNRAAVSHAFSLGEIPVPQAEEIADKLSELGMSIMSTIPITKSLPPIELLDRKGVNVYLGCDGFYDSWGPFGNGDLLEKVTRYGELYRKSDELSLAQSLKWATGGPVPLNKDGEVAWPFEGDDANLVLVAASCSAEAVARTPKREAVIFKGKIVSGQLS
ncbi:cytosine/adenosine deaminase-related metal-dependent hydrolase [Cytobacillus oceanisediminis]|jgi:cytosine/adenosine deaminase-related metal-dependent hydrolase|uniref:Cytosine/adenosine deaminase-related metal-dependent hydrolase n=1 Tax=Cytobacillus oceanisediminis TaxID=665099 RepID=A0A2V2ZN15_9BACI|nr:amidohydrolase [Cytobacillus oceanisediminis]PWW25466.1 cytosine/adenosine deaminase-related metal-dependent hydrolase [Cytobacillus oceanisediminis]